MERVLARRNYCWSWIYVEEILANLMRRKCLGRFVKHHLHFDLWIHFDLRYDQEVFYLCCSSMLVNCMLSPVGILMLFYVEQLTMESNYWDCLMIWRIHSNILWLDSSVSEWHDISLDSLILFEPKPEEESWNYYLMRKLNCYLLVRFVVEHRVRCFAFLLSVQLILDDDFR